MKKCRLCGERKDSNEFGVDKQKKDGLNYYCKICIRERSKAYREKYPEYCKRYAIKYRETNREILKKKSWLTYYIDWEKRREQGKKSYEKHKKEIAEKRAQKRSEQNDNEKNRLKQKAWRNTNKTKSGTYVTEWKKRNPQKAAAHILVLWAVRTKMIIKPNICEECKIEKKLEAHHDDYLKPLEVNWLCKNCHAKKHRIYR